MKKKIAVHERALHCTVRKNLALEEALDLLLDRIQNDEKYVCHCPVTEVHLIYKMFG